MTGIVPQRPAAAARHIHVACGIIEKDGLTLAAQRGPAMSLPLKWEFPGGKIQSGESPEDCLHRELREELGIAVVVLQRLSPTTHRYPSFTVTLHPMRCAIESGTLTAHEHAAVAWLDPARLPALDWAEADLPVIGEYLSLRSAP